MVAKSYVRLLHAICNELAKCAAVNNLTHRPLVHVYMIVEDVLKLVNMRHIVKRSSMSTLYFALYQSTSVNPLVRAYL